MRKYRFRLVAEIEVEAPNAVVAAQSFKDRFAPKVIAGGYTDKRWDRFTRTITRTTIISQKIERVKP